MGLSVLGSGGGGGLAVVILSRSVDGCVDVALAHGDGLFVFRGGFVFRRRETDATGPEQEKERRETDWATEREC